MRCICRHLEVAADRLPSRERGRDLSEARDWTAVLAVEAQAVTLTELGQRFNRDVATVSNAARKLRERILKNADLADRLAQMQRELMQKTKA